MAGNYTDEELRGYSPEHVAGYLDKLGWAADGDFGGYGTFYRAPSGERTLVSAKPRSIKYARRVLDVVALVTEEHGYSHDAVLRDLRYLRHDITRLRASSYRNGNALLPNEFASLAQGAQKLQNDAINAALTDDDDRRSYRDGQVGIPAIELGSFIIPMISPPLPFAVQPPLTAHGDAESVVLSKPPIARQVTEMLRKSVQATRNALNEYKKTANPDAFADAEQKSIRRSTCDGLRDALGSLYQVRCEVIETVLPGIPHKPPSPITFSSDDADPLKDASEIIRKAKWMKRSKFELTGYIRRCDKKREDEKGKVSLEVLMPHVEGEQTVHVLLDPDQFDIAVGLFRANADVEAMGALEQKGDKIWDLEDAQIRRRATRGWDDIDRD